MYNSKFNSSLKDRKDCAVNNEKKGKSRKLSVVCVNMELKTAP